MTTATTPVSISSVSADEQQIIDGLLKFVDQEIIPIQKGLGEVFTNPRLYWREDGTEAAAITQARQAARMASAKAGYYTMFCPKEFGGADLGIRMWFLCWEALHYRYGPPMTQLAYYVLSRFASGPHEVWRHASQSLQRKVIPDLASGRLQGCFGLTEPDAGSDSWMMKTTAVKDGKGWIINGTKQWTSWSPTADFVMVYAITDKELVAQRKGGISCFYVPTDTLGYRFESVLKIFGHIGGEEGILSFTNVRIPDEHLVGELHRGFDLAMLGVKHGRISNAAMTIGMARWAMDKAIAYANIRKTFGKTLAEHQTIQNYLAESVIKLYAARMMALDCAAKADAGRDVRSEISMLKLFATRSGYEVIDKCIQIHGGMGIANETGLFDALCMTRLTQIGEGASEIQLRSIAQQLLRGRVDMTFQ